MLGWDLLPALTLQKGITIMKQNINLNEPKWLLVIVYIFFVIMIWLQRSLIPAPLGAFTRDMVVIALLGAGFVCLVQLLRTPPFKAIQFQLACKRNGIKNCSNEYPRLRFICLDKHRLHSVIYEIENRGITVSELEGKTEQLNTALNVRIDRIELCNKSTRTRLYATPRKYVRPTVITPNNEIFIKEFCKLPNTLCVGNTGSGKSYALTVLLGIYAKYIPGLNITVCDYKKSSFGHLADTPNFYGYENVPDGIRAFYQEFSERLEANNEDRNKQVRVLLIDEYGALISAQDKKTAEELKTMVANMLFMGRSLGIRLLIGVQRADAEHFKAGARDQFRAILALGNLSKEQKQMLFSDFKGKMDGQNNGLGEGYLLIDGKDIERVKVAPIKDIEQLNDSIRQAMCR